MGNLVLVIDADSLQRRYIGALLAADGFDVMQFERAVKGMVAITTVEPALIILASGPGLASDAHRIRISELVRIFRRLTDAPLMVIGDPQSPDEINSLVSGGDLFLQRGFGPSELISRSRMLVSREGDSSSTTEESGSGVDGRNPYSDVAQIILEVLAGMEHPNGRRVA